MADIKISCLTTARELDKAVDLQTVYWGPDAANLVPRHMLYSICHHGGHILGAFDGGQMVGFVMGFIGTEVDGEVAAGKPAAESLLIMSKRMLVLPHYRGQNIGYRLKMAQREIAGKQDISLVTWTFDPLLAANAHLNIRKLGATVKRYAINYFGLEESESLTADRLIVHWRVKRRKAEACAAGKVSRRTLHRSLAEGATIVNPAELENGRVAPLKRYDKPKTSSIMVELPSNIPDLEMADPELGRRWRYHLRELLPSLIDSGYAITDFLRDESDGFRRTYYFLCLFAQDRM